MKNQNSKTKNIEEKNSKNILDKIIIIIFNVTLLLTSIWITVIPVTKSEKFYMYEFEKNNTVNESGYNEDELSIIIKQIINYLLGEEESMQVTINDKFVFSNQALNHMRDVKTIYVTGNTLGWISFFIFLLTFAYIIVFFKKTKPFLLKFSLYTVGLILLLILLFGTYAILDFDNAFILFHKILFPDPQKFNDAFFSYFSNYEELPYINNLMLITILDEKVFMDAGLMIFGSVIIFEGSWFTFLFINNKKNKLLKNKKS